MSPDADLAGCVHDGVPDRAVMCRVVSELSGSPRALRRTTPTCCHAVSAVPGEEVSHV
ncbi:hypothetical protein [Kibdelosporangium philippinense]|uniref:hypothetical protein n=1 Tax=Kibdelosporangium philippinense TaxID=211113 RepID=UPI00361EA7FB